MAKKVEERNEGGTDSTGNDIGDVNAQKQDEAQARELVGDNPAEAVAALAADNDRPKRKKEANPYAGFTSDQVAAANRGRLARGEEIFVPEGLDDEPRPGGRSMMEVEAEEAGLAHPQESGAGGDVSEEKPEDK